MPYSLLAGTEKPHLESNGPGARYSGDLRLDASHWIKIVAIRSCLATRTQPAPHEVVAWIYILQSKFASAMASSSKFLAFGVFRDAEVQLEPRDEALQLLCAERFVYRSRPEKGVGAPGKALDGHY